MQACLVIVALSVVYAGGFFAVSSVELPNPHLGSVLLNVSLWAVVVTLTQRIWSMADKISSHETLASSRVQVADELVRKLTSKLHATLLFSVVATASTAIAIAVGDKWPAFASTGMATLGGNVASSIAALALAFGWLGQVNQCVTKLVERKKRSDENKAVGHRLSSVSTT